MPRFVRHVILLPIIIRDRRPARGRTISRAASEIEEADIPPAFDQAVHACCNEIAINVRLIKRPFTFMEENGSALEVDADKVAIPARIPENAPVQHATKDGPRFFDTLKVVLGVVILVAGFLAKPHGVLNELVDIGQPKIRAKSKSVRDPDNFPEYLEAVGKPSIHVSQVLGDRVPERRLGFGDRGRIQAGGRRDISSVIPFWPRNRSICASFSAIISRLRPQGVARTTPRIRRLAVSCDWEAWHRFRPSV